MRETVKTIVCAVLFIAICWALFENHRHLAKDMDRMFDTMTTQSGVNVALAERAKTNADHITELQAQVRTLQQQLEIAKQREASQENRISLALRGKFGR